MEKVHRPKLSGRSRVVVVCAHPTTPAAATTDSPTSTAGSWRRFSP